MIKKLSQQKNQQQVKQTKPKKTMATLRLQKDIQTYQQEKIDCVKLQFPQQNSIQVINVVINVKEQSIYKNTKVIFQLKFPNQYPMDPPKLKCLSRLYHPNINYQGAVCMPLVRQDFNPTVNLTMIICGLIYIMTFPNFQDALNPQISNIMKKDPTMLYKIVDYTIRGRTFENKEYDNIVDEEIEKTQFSFLTKMKRLISEKEQSNQLWSVELHKKTSQPLNEHLQNQIKPQQ